MPEPREKARRKQQCFDVSCESHSSAAEFYGENYLHLLKGEASQNCGCTSDSCDFFFFRQLWFVCKLNKRKRRCKRSPNRLRFETCFCYFLALQDFRKVIHLSGPLSSSKKGTCNIGLEWQLNKKKCSKYLVLPLQYTRCSLNCSYFFIQVIDRNSERTQHWALNKRLPCHVRQKVMGVRMQDRIYGWDASYNKTRQKPGN